MLSDLLNVTEAPLEGDVVVSAKDEYDHYGKPAVSMSMNSDGARRWAQLTKQNVGKSNRYRFGRLCLLRT